MSDIFGAILVFLMGIVFGWIFAHSEISTECEKLNSFYVGSKTFQCEIKK